MTSITIFFSGELTELIEELQEFTEKEMKIEMAPWVKNYTVPMDKLYTELILEQIENKPTGPISVKLGSYLDLFTEKETTNKQETHPETSSEAPRKKGRKRRGKKILAKADPGMGKSTFGKKIAFDWAKGVFTAVSVVFFVSMKLIRPGQTIENVIIDQYPPLEASRINERSLKTILDMFGEKCLLILDGLDEHALRSYDDILKIIQGHKLQRCGIIVTMRPHRTHEIERYFSMAVNIKGFSRSSAEQFASKLLTDREKEEAVLQFSPYPSEAYPPWYQCPMLLSFLCILVRDYGINLKENAIPLGEIYTKLLRCLYMTFTVRQDIDYQTTEFISVLHKVGKIALETLKFGPLMRRGDIIDELGTDAFNYGLIVGNDNPFLHRYDETSNIFISFLERGMQDFLGAFYFTRMLDTGESLEELLCSFELQ